MPRGPFFTQRPGGFGAGFFTGDVRETLQREMNRVFDEVWRNMPGSEDGAPSASASTAQPAPRSFSVDVTETATEVRVRADLPGVSEQDVDVTLDDDRLTIRAERRREQRTGAERTHTVECTVGVFQRSVRLPAPVDPEQVDASFDRGVLTVTLSKPRAAERGRKIPIRGAGAPAAGFAGGVRSEPTADASLAGGATGGTPVSGSVTGGAGGSAEGAGAFGLIEGDHPSRGAGGAEDASYTQGDGALGASPSTGVGAEPQASTDTENAAKPGGAVHGYNE